MVQIGAVRPHLTVHSGGGPTSPVALIGHAGLALGRLRGAPTGVHLERACGLGLSRLEVDVCETADGHIVLRHDLLVERGSVARPGLLISSNSEPAVRSAASNQPMGGGPWRIPERTAVNQLTLAELRRLDPELLSLEGAVSVLAGRVPLLIDLKTDSVAAAVGRWLSRRRDVADFAVCTESVAALLSVRRRAPRAERWPSFPDIGSHHREHLGRILTELWRGHRELQDARRSLIELQRALLDARSRPHHSLANLAGLPWRSRLPEQLAARSREVAAAGLCVQHWLVNPDLCRTAAGLRLPITAWTVNQAEVARRVADCGVDLITTDRVEFVREAMSSPRLGSAIGGAVLPIS